MASASVPRAEATGLFSVVPLGLARGSLWLDVFHEKYSLSKDFKEREDIVGAYLVVEMNDGRRVYGWPEYFSDEFKEGPVLFLTRARWLLEDNEKLDIPYPGIMIMGSEIKSIQFYFQQENE
ncbi:MAG: hypothetical protein H8E87_06065 [FCB group bacterium]|nr:hypothetical protein [FCB group bacterium]